MIKREKMKQFGENNLDRIQIECNLSLSMKPTLLFDDCKSSENDLIKTYCL